ncbi:MAG: fluoride efflux transporter CrcB [Endomicrobiales bacterium]
MSKFVELVIGGSIGTISRYLLGGFVYGVFGAAFPYGTMAVNLLGCFVVGFLSTMAEERFLLGSNVRLMLMIGFCGAFTTFSSLILETNNLVRDGEMMRAFMNLLLSVIIGFIFLRLGVLVAEIV